MMSFDMPDNGYNTFKKLTQTGIIRNMDYFNQIYNFNGFPLKGQDVDYECDLDGQAFIRAEFKFGDSPVPMGQQIAAKSWCRAVGVRKSAFFVIARHNIEAPHEVPTEALEIDCVYWKTPEMQDYAYHKYRGKDVPTVNQFLVTIAVHYGFYHYLDLPKSEIDRYWPYDKVFADAWDSKQAQKLREVANKKLCAGLGVEYVHQAHEAASVKRKLLAESPPHFTDYIIKPY